MTGDAVKAIGNAGLTNHVYEWYCPQLPASPQESMAMVSAHIEQSSASRLVVVGSSLGGFTPTTLLKNTTARVLS